jgi:hypothetical protein
MGCSVSEKRLTAEEVERMEEAADIASYRPNYDRLVAALRKHDDDRVAMRKALEREADAMTGTAYDEDVDDETVWGYK